MANGRRTVFLWDMTEAEGIHSNVQMDDGYSMDDSEWVKR